MKEKIFRWVLINHPEGQMLTKFQVFVWAVLFPTKWLIRKHTPYDPIRDVWIIHNKKFSGRCLFDLANCNGESFRINASGDCVILERIDT